MVRLAKKSSLKVTTPKIVANIEDFDYRQSPALVLKVSEKVHATRNRKFDEPERREVKSTGRTALRTRQEVIQQDFDKKNEDSNQPSGSIGPKEKVQEVHCVIRWCRTVKTPLYVKIKGINMDSIKWWRQRTCK
ncbi:unnamed protein product [Bursaphelenchus xylophilus]|uniref:(pine wood nematode) hypothetical protein n=1 Tax=Bursaphelenchus xylophilus TaxID=6326 RepID=A0A1I7SE68_BURXY|nr:unnamed protein product [Bursaphelenchus xylophilus]CAG9088599.1 unnamed protein product [Bursaphelenchus xylophilus]